jgi:hypothetical protein
MTFFTSKSQIAALIDQCPAVDGAMQNQTAARQASLTKPPCALG